MNQYSFAKLVEDTFAACQKLLHVKGQEYSGLEDRLANFRRGAMNTGLRPEQVAFVYLSKHYDAIATFVREGPVVGGESIDGRLHDLINYCLLLKAIIQESPKCDTPTSLVPTFTVIPPSERHVSNPSPKSSPPGSVTESPPTPR